MELTWRDAIIKVLQNRSEPMHYADIAEAIETEGLRTDLGPTPANSVAATISLSLRNDVVRVTRGYYALRNIAETPAIQPLPSAPEEPDDAGLINAFGMYWTRTNVLWSANPRVLGQQQPGSTPVDFSGERGVYLLHDGRAVVYVGRTTDQTLGIRLKQHTVDRLNGRWDRFSWFGVYPVTAQGGLDTGSFNYDLEMLITTMEALLIEGLEPPQNRKRGDDFRAVEFLQVLDPEIQKNQILQTIEELKKKL